ncbi:MAG: DNA-protecting protein DprA [Mycobacteriaceae bacterium]|nr:DNA-protecting protein DprA [Mycobacteriaceae bacterium]
MVGTTLGATALAMKGGLGSTDAKAKFSHMFSQNRAVNLLAAARVFLFASRDVWFVVGLPVFLRTVLNWSFWQVGSFMALWVIGPLRLDEVCERAAAIVGTRACTAYGEHVAAELSTGLVEREVSVVSGGAYGIDGAAHRAALAADGATVAVLAGGLDVLYPAGHSALLHRISQTGLLVSEYPPGVRPARHRFLTRNRLVAALARATVVVEAGLRSGAASTAAWARGLGRVVCAVPGPVTSSSSTGCHILLREGAELVTCADEVREIVGRAGEFADRPAGPRTALDELTEIERQIYDAVPARGASTPDQIAVASGVAAAQVLGPLAMLEIAGLVQRQEGRWRLARGT